MDSRSFLENYQVTDIEKDPLPIKVLRNAITKDEIPGQAMHWGFEYLDQRLCPLTLTVHILEKLYQEVHQTDFSHCSESSDDALDGSDNTKSGSQYEPLKLMRAIVKKLDEICIKEKEDYQDSVDGMVEAPDMEPHVFAVSYGNIKNTRRFMEDRMTVLPRMDRLFKLPYPISYFAVFDGHNGAEAAAYGAAQLHQYLIQSMNQNPDVISSLSDAFERVDAAFVEKCRSGKIKSGSTAVLSLIMPEKLYVAWLGDSQAVLVKNNEINNLVNPHKPERKDEIDRIRSLGGEVIQMHDTYRVNGNLAVSRAIGDADQKTFIISLPDIKMLELDGSEEFLILACDGLWDEVSPEAAAQIVRRQVVCNPSNTSAISQTLIQQAKMRGSQDNISVIVVFFEPLESLKNRYEGTIDMEVESDVAIIKHSPEPIGVVPMEKFIEHGIASNSPHLTEFNGHSKDSEQLVDFLSFGSSKESGAQLLGDEGGNQSGDEDDLAKKEVEEELSDAESDDEWQFEKPSQQSLNIASNLIPVGNGLSDNPFALEATVYNSTPSNDGAISNFGSSTVDQVNEEPAMLVNDIEYTNPFARESEVTVIPSGEILSFTMSPEGVNENSLDKLDDSNVNCENSSVDEVSEPNIEGVVNSDCADDVKILNDNAGGLLSKEDPNPFKSDGPVEPLLFDTTSLHLRQTFEPNFDADAGFQNADLVQKESVPELTDPLILKEDSQVFATQEYATETVNQSAPAISPQQEIIPDILSKTDELGNSENDAVVESEIQIEQLDMQAATPIVNGDNLDVTHDMEIGNQNPACESVAKDDYNPFTTDDYGGGDVELSVYDKTSIHLQQSFELESHGEELLTEKSEGQIAFSTESVPELTEPIPDAEKTETDPVEELLDAAVITSKPVDAIFEEEIQSQAVEMLATEQKLTVDFENQSNETMKPDSTLEFAIQSVANFSADQDFIPERENQTEELALDAQVIHEAELCPGSASQIQSPDVIGKEECDKETSQTFIEQSNDLLANNEVNPLKADAPETVNTLPQDADVISSHLPHQSFDSNWNVVSCNEDSIIASEVTPLEKTVEDNVQSTLIESIPLINDSPSLTVDTDVVPATQEIIPEIGNVPTEVNAVKEISSVSEIVSEVEVDKKEIVCQPAEVTEKQQVTDVTGALLGNQTGEVVQSEQGVIAENRPEALHIPNVSEVTNEKKADLASKSAKSPTKQDGPAAKGRASLASAKKSPVKADTVPGSKTSGPAKPAVGARVPSKTTVIASAKPSTGKIPPAATTRPTPGPKLASRPATASKSVNGVDSKAPGTKTAASSTARARPITAPASKTAVPSTKTTSTTSVGSTASKRALPTGTSTAPKPKPLSASSPSKPGDGPVKPSATQPRPLTARPKPTTTPAPSTKPGVGIDSKKAPAPRPAPSTLKAPAATSRAPISRTGPTSARTAAPKPIPAATKTLAPKPPTKMANDNSKAGLSGNKPTARPTTAPSSAAAKLAPVGKKAEPTSLKTKKPVSTMIGTTASKTTKSTISKKAATDSNEKADLIQQNGLSNGSDDAVRDLNAINGSMNGDHHEMNGETEKQDATKENGIHLDDQSMEPPELSQPSASIETS